ncbi:MAG TPA: cytochrome c oxidase assembly protein [Gemmatimonadaceae bacterium]
MVTGVQWWCSAQGTAWTWRWRPYPGIWLVALGIASSYWALTRRIPDTAKARSRRVIGWIGVLVVWLSLDWPLGPLAAGYLASAHAIQFLVLTMGASPLLLLGLEPGLTSRSEPRGVAWRAWRVLTMPLMAAIVFNVIAAATHVPGVVDGLMVSQFGAFVLDIAWLVAGVVFWWPVLTSVPRHNFPVLFKVLYIFLGTMIHSGIAIVMLLAEFPIYSIYQLAPPMHGLTAMTDLQIAGGIMEIGGTLIAFGVMTALFFTWVQQSGAGEREGA